MLVSAKWNEDAIARALQVLREGDITEFMARDPAWNTFYWGISRDEGDRVKLQARTQGGTRRTKIEPLDKIEDYIRNDLWRPWTKRDYELHSSKSVEINDETTAILALTIASLCFRNTSLEEYHVGEVPQAANEDCSAVWIVHPKGKIRWPKLRRLSSHEEQALREEVTNGVYTVLRHIHHPEYRTLVCSSGADLTRRWNRPTSVASIENALRGSNSGQGEAFIDDDRAARLALVIADTGLGCPQFQDLLTGEWPYSEIGDYSDVRVVGPNGEIGWNDLSRISDREMAELNKCWANRVYTILRHLDKPSAYELLLRQGEELILTWGRPTPIRGLGAIE